jgi:hypothetical protein
MEGESKVEIGSNDADVSRDEKFTWHDNIRATTFRRSFLPAFRSHRHEAAFAHQSN